MSKCNHEIGRIVRDKVYANLSEMAVYTESEARGLLSAESDEDSDEEVEVVKHLYCPKCGEKIDWDRIEINLILF
jgi:exosome complex RNA-binding protein Csl4